MTSDSPRRHRARKRFGQHFLEPAWVAKVVEVIDPRPDETFVEIGPGRGALTRPLAARAKNVVAFEIDRDLARDLAAAAPVNVRVVEGDFLAATDVGSSNPTTMSSGGHDRIRVAGNLPYNVASPILFKLVDMHLAGVPLADATVMLQREVADRLLAVPGTKDYGVLTVLIRHSARVRRLLNLPPGAFRPAPKVQSTVVRLDFHAADPPVRNTSVFRELVQAVFTRRRKTLANALLAYPVVSAGYSGPTLSRTGVGPEYVLRRAGIDGSRRPETLTVEEFARLADSVAISPQKT
jgi:16S rRNA (adenine1518-N6/adenine1519-N6)-dimethyltransferase